MLKIEFDLEELALKHGTDKSSNRHDYCRYYEDHFKSIRSKKMTILEIGVLDGKSLRMWKDYFYNSNIVGLDIDVKCKNYEEERIKIKIGDQSDDSILFELVSNYNFDIIIDDGSHIWDHLVKSFEFLFPHLNSNGFYCMEDLLDCYDSNHKGACGIHAINYLKNTIDNVNIYGNVTKTNKANKSVRAAGMKKHILKNNKSLDFRNHIESLHFYCGLCVIKKN